MPIQMKAIDLYSGVGGWSLGLRLAGIDVCASYEKSEAANKTNRSNNGHQAFTADIRKLNLADLPKNIQIIVGSPPCTQFSFSNRGGNGDLSEGFEDVIRFFEIVDHVKPMYWVMENVPRLAKILDFELGQGGRLERFKHLDIGYRIFNMEQFGLPQRRRRCIVGNLDFDLLESYKKRCSPITLGSVLNSLSGDLISDPVYGHQIDAKEIHDHELEEPLDYEEVRINSASKQLHPIYNTMPFPDQLNRSVRTVTATCTRVSRESIIIETSAGSGKYRRLSVRERASAQGFPISYQFYGTSYSEKLKMVGNAIPPLFAYFIGHALRKTRQASVPKLTRLTGRLTTPEKSKNTPPHKPGFRYRKDRSFQFCVPSLRLKSGVRFELNNGIRQGFIDWHVMLVFGTSKSIRHLRPRSSVESAITSILPKASAISVTKLIDRQKVELNRVDVQNLQAVWSHSGPGSTRPFMVLDLLDEFAVDLISLLESQPEGVVKHALESTLKQELGHDAASGCAKLIQHSTIILAGLVVASYANGIFSKKNLITQNSAYLRSSKGC